jgi:hypothetical protein
MKAPPAVIIFRFVTVTIVAALMLIALSVAIQHARAPSGTSPGASPVRSVAREAAR